MLRPTGGHPKQTCQPVRDGNARSLTTRYTYRLKPIYTLKPCYNDPFNNKIFPIYNLILSSSVVSSIIENLRNNKTLAIKNKIFVPFRFVKPRFQCINVLKMWQYFDSLVNAMMCVLLSTEFVRSL
jgi:hypothetical protein